MKIGKYRIYLKNHDLIALLIIYGWSTWYFFSSNKLGQHKQTMAFIAPMYYVLLVLGVLYLFKTLKIEKIEGEPEVPAEKKIPVWDQGRSWLLENRRMIGFVVLLALYLFIMPKLGFIISTILYLSITTIWLGNRNKLQIVVVSLAATLITYFLFEKFFLVRLPHGLFY